MLGIIVYLFRQRIAGVVCIIVGVSTWATVVPNSHPLGLGPHAAPDLGWSFPKLKTSKQTIHGIWFSVVGAGVKEEQAMIAVLRDPGTVSAKEQACELLRRVGSVASIPALEAYLGDERLSHAARLALEAMPFPEAAAALREALDTASGAIKVGLIESLGTRGEPESAPALAPLARARDPQVAAAAALALGKIGGPVSVEALQAARVDSVESVQVAVREGLLCCAEALRLEDAHAAHALYADILKDSESAHVHTAAYRGMILTADRDSTALITSALVLDDPALWAAALPAVRNLGGREATDAFVALIGNVPKALLPGLVEALAQRGDRAAATAVAEVVDDANPVVRATAIRALGVIGDRSVVPILVRVAAHGEEADRGVAATALARLSATGVSAAMHEMIDEADVAETAVVARIMGQRRDETARPSLVRMTKSLDAGVRTAAAQSLAEVGNAGDAALLCDLLAQSNEAEESAAVERALVSLGSRLQSPREFVDPVLSGLHSDDSDVRFSMLRVCGALRHPEFLQALNHAVIAEDTDVRDAAIRALADSPDHNALAYLLPALETASTLTHRVLIFRGIARLASDPDGVEVAVREDALRQALTRAERAEEKKLLLAGLGTCHTTSALDCVETFLSMDGVEAEATMAWIQIANALLTSDPDRLQTSAYAVFDRVRGTAIPEHAQQGVLEIVRAVGPTAISADRVRFERIVLDERFRSEGVAVADVNRDGHNDVLAGDVWYAGPDWEMREIRDSQTYDPEQGYSQCFANFTADVDTDGWVDSIVIGFPGAPAFWYRNPGNAAEHWQAHQLASSACGETPIFGDLLGDGRALPVFALDSRITWFQPQADPTSDWQAFPVTEKLPAFELFGHGLGMGDVNGDGRADLLTTDGWWEAPEDRSRADWTFHEAALGPACADMVVHDVDGDGDGDILTSSAHKYGVWWFEQQGMRGATTFKQHEIYSGISQTHALVLADINNDGSQDLITGKRYRAHNGNDPGSDEPAVLCWIELHVPEKGSSEVKVHEIDHDSGVGTQFKVSDVDRDGLLDVVISNKKGVYVFLQRRTG